MSQSRITTKNQTTVPREVRQRLGVGPKDTLVWDLLEGRVEVSPASRRFLSLRGTILVGAGNVARDIRRARGT